MTTNEKINPSPARPGTGGPAARLDPLTKTLGSQRPIGEPTFERSEDRATGFAGPNAKGKGHHDSAIVSGSAADYDATIPSTNEQHSTGRAQIDFDTVISSLTERGKGR